MKAIAALSLATVAQASTFSTETIHKDSAPLISSVGAENIPDSYIIKFKDHVDATGADDHHNWVQDLHKQDDANNFELRKRGLADQVFTGLKHTYSIGDHFKGYSGHFHPDIIEKVRNHPDVEYIELDSVVHALHPVAGENAVTEDNCDGDRESHAPWGLARVSHRNRLSFATYNSYLYTTDAGEGVDAYVIDTGTNTDHVDFEGRAKWGKTIPQGDADEDGNGHGTHCSGTVAGKKYGVAKKAHVYAVKVLRSNGSGTMSDVVEGVEYAATAHQEQLKLAKDGKRKGFKGSVANMSLGGGKTSALDAAVNAAVKAGIHFAVAAGNDNADACKYSPAAAERPVTVGASNLGDARAYFSNYGTCVDIFAPGENILSTWIGSKYATNTISGTSMASPHICGLLAYYLSLQPAQDSEFAVAAITPKKLKEDIISIATKGALDNVDAQTPNLLAWNGGGCQNYSSILEAGSVTVEREEAPLVLKDWEKFAEEKVLDVNSKIEKLADKIHDFVESEMEDFLKASA